MNNHIRVRIIVIRDLSNSAVECAIRWRSMFYTSYLKPFQIQRLGNIACIVRATDLHEILWLSPALQW